MDHRQRVLTVVILTLVISFSVGFVSEYVRDTMTFSWAIDVGEEFVFDIVVMGNTSTGTTVLPPPYAIMNNTRISVEVISLPNVSTILYSGPFIETVVDHLKTNASFVNGTEIPVQYYDGINSLVSDCLLPVGGWIHLDAFFPNQLERPIMNRESYLSAHMRSFFFFGYKSNTTNYELEWHGLIDLATGIPNTVSFSIIDLGQPWNHFYTVTMTLVE